MATFILMFRYRKYLVNALVELIPTMLRKKHGKKLH